MTTPYTYSQQPSAPQLNRSSCYPAPLSSQPTCHSPATSTPAIIPPSSSSSCYRPPSHSSSTSTPVSLSGISLSSTCATPSCQSSRQSSPFSSCSHSTSHVPFSPRQSTPLQSCRSTSTSCCPDSTPLTINGLSVAEIEQCIINSAITEGINSTCCLNMIPDGTVLGTMENNDVNSMSSPTTTAPLTSSCYNRPTRCQSKSIEYEVMEDALSSMASNRNQLVTPSVCQGNSLRQSTCCSSPASTLASTTSTTSKATTMILDSYTPTMQPIVAPGSCLSSLSFPVENTCNPIIGHLNAGALPMSGSNSGPVSGPGPGPGPATIPSRSYQINGAAIRCNTESSFCSSSSPHLSSASSPSSSRSSMSLEDCVYPLTTSSSSPIPAMFPNKGSNGSPYSGQYMFSSPRPFPMPLASVAAVAIEEDRSAIGRRVRCHWAGCNAETISSHDLLTHLLELHIPHQENVSIYCQWESCWTQHVNVEQLLWHLRVHHNVAPISMPQPSQQIPQTPFMEMDIHSYPVSSSSFTPQSSSSSSPSPLTFAPSSSPFSPSSVATIPSTAAADCTSLWSASSTEVMQYIIKQEETFDLSPSQEVLLQQEQYHPCLWRDCKLYFTQFETLTSHLSEEHIGMGKSEYICEWTNCDRQGRGFSQRQKAMRHIQTHTGDKPFQCQVCQKRFSEANIMAQHMRTHTGEKPFKCTEPGCTRQFSISGALTIHRRVHTGEKPFKCKFEGCDKWFAESSNLTKHLRVHTGERPFQCPYVGCDKRFSRPDQVTRHKKTHLTDAERIAVLKAEKAAEYRRMG